MNKLTTKDIIGKWLYSYWDRPTVSYHDLEWCKAYGVGIYNVVHNIGTYDRAFRLLREGNELSKYGIKLELLEDSNVYDTWKIVKLF